MLQDPPCLTYLQNEGLAMKWNLKGIYSVPILLWQGQKVVGRWLEGIGDGLVAQEWMTGRAGFQ
jgi:hypothetical protein